ncbi:MAG TPA: hypothetical protein PLU30_18970 [Verrucomicrobiae bacterium]|nr:hypothetical protein [Verrucomicrobiae bacterium]
MDTKVSRRCFLQTTATGLLSSGALLAMAQRLSAAPPELGLRSKIRVGKIYLGRPRGGWPTPLLDLEAEIRRFEAEMAKLPGLGDIEFIDCGLVSDAAQIAGAREKCKDASGLLVVHLSIGTAPLMQALMESNIPMVIFSMPYSGHEWHVVAGWQREGRLVDVLPSSRYEDIAVAVRPFRAVQRLRETRVLHVSTREANAEYCGSIREKFGTEIISLGLADLQKAYQEVDQSEARADAERWAAEAEKIVEPGKDDILKGSVMYVAMRNLLAQHNAQAITMNCLGMGLIDRGMGYPCLGFVRFNNCLLAGVCEADLKSTMTQLIFTYLVGRTGFVTDPVFDLSTSSIIHAHCVAATQMEGPSSKPAPYHIRTHLEDNRGVSLQVRMPVGGKITMARLIGTDKLLFSTGDAIDSPFVDRGCRSKLTMRVENPDRFLANWSCGLHRVIFYGDHGRDVARFCRLTKIRMLYEGVDDLRDVEGLEWEPRVHA